jgi:phage protein D/phage baseplate assembly protein gpV
VAVSSRQFTSVPHISVNGSPLADDQMGRVTEVVVEQSLHLPDMFVIRLHDVGDDSAPQYAANFKILDAQTFAIGGQVTIAMGYGEAPDTVTKGEITAIELEASMGRPPELVVRGYARSHRLHRGRQTKSYLNVTDSDLATTIASAAGLQASVDSTTEVHDYVLQHNQTNWEFLKERASRIGYEVFVDDKTLHFRKPLASASPSVVQHLWSELLSLRVTVSSAFQAQKVVVRGWDPQQKAAIVGDASTGSLAPKTGLESGASTASAFGDATMYVVDRPVASQSEAATLAQAICDGLDASFVHAEGICAGDPTVKPGVTVQLPTIGTQLSGTYYITSATHHLTHDGYTTAFVVSGQQTNSVLELVNPHRDAVPFPSVVIGVVTDNTDPDGQQGRVKVKFPWLTDNDNSWWARIASPMAGNGRGFYFLPEVNDEVLVSFEHGDINRPYILGALWNGQDDPPKKNSEVVANSKVNQRILQTRAGHVITLDDTDNAAKITIKTPAGHTLTMDDTNGSESVSLVDKTGNNLIKIESSSNKITIAANGDVAVSAQGNLSAQANGNASVKANGNVDVEAQGQATVKANAGATVQSQANLDLKGAIVNVEAEGTMSIKANGPLTLKGAIVSIN